MNFLAHLWLSGDDEDLMIGNFIADEVRRLHFDQYRPGVVRGMELHQQIDDFTDQHPEVEHSKIRLRPHQGKYSPVVVDILYDHFLARFFSDYSVEPLEEFAQRCYRLLENRQSELPAAIQAMLPVMVRHNWLVSYASLEGFQRVLKGMSKRANFANRMDRAPEDIAPDYEQYLAEFRSFFPELQQHVNRALGR